MDPGQLTDINSMRVLSSVYDTLVRFKEGSFTQEPGLATVLEDVARRPAPTPSRCARASSSTTAPPSTPRRSSSPTTACSTPSIPRPRPGPFPFASFYYGAIKEVDRRRSGRPSASRLKQPFSPLLNNLHPQHRPHRQPGRGEEVRQGVRRATRSAPARSSSSSWDQNVRIVLEANAGYWDGAPEAASGSCSGRWWRSRPASPSCCRAASTSSSTSRPTTWRRSRRTRDAGLLRAAGPAHLVGDAQHREEAVQRRAGAPGGELRGEPGARSPAIS